MSLPHCEMVHTSVFPSLPPSPLLPFTDILLEQWKHYPRKIALVDPDTDEGITYRELAQKVRQMEHSLQGIGVVEGQMIGVIAGNSVDYIVFCLAAIQLGAILVPINPAYKKYEITKYMRNVVSVFTDREYLEKVSECVSEMEGNPTVHIIGNILLHDEAREREKWIHPEHTAFIFFSSGTSGPPKAICISHRAFTNHIMQIKTINEKPQLKLPIVSNEDTVYGVLPYFHAGGLVTVFCMLSVGARLVINKKFDEKRFLSVIDEYKVTVLSLVPAVLPFLSSSPPQPALRTVFIGASRVDPALARSFMINWPEADLIQMYGLTEGGVLVFMTPRDRNAADSVGIALPGVEFTICDGERVCDIGEEGELWLKTSTMMTGYLDGQPAQQWLDTGDRAVVDKEGNVRIVGRTKEMIKVRGWQVSPYELEEAILSNVAGVRECAIVGIPHPKDGHQPHAFIVGQVCPDTVLDFVKEHFVSYKHLAAVSIVEELPKTASGKLIRSRLVEEWTS